MLVTLWGTGNCGLFGGKNISLFSMFLRPDAEINFLFGKIFPFFAGTFTGMGKIFRPAINEETMGVNPFASSLVIRAYSLRSGYVPDEEGLMMDNMVDMDAESFAKMFDKAENRLVMTGLSFRALQVWTWSMFTVEAGKDYVWVNVPRLMEECRIKAIKTFRAAVTELMRYGYMAPVAGYKNVYWLNPAMGFKGSRIKKYPENVTRKWEE